MGKFVGTLNHNLVVNALYNMIISQQIFADNIRSGANALVDDAKVDGTLFGDKKIYIATDVLRSYEWGNDNEAGNLLAIDRPPLPDQQEIVITNYRQIALTIDNYLTKQAFMDEGTFIQFNGVQLDWLGNTKRVFEKTMYNAFIGTHETSVGKQQVEITLPSTSGQTGVDLNATYNLRALEISRHIENIGDELEDPNRNYNDYENLREISKDDITIIMNNKYANEFRNIDLPGIFHNENIVPKAKKLLYRYFGQVTTANGNAPTPNTDTTTEAVRSMIEVDFNVDGQGHLLKMNDPNYDKKKHIFPGDLWPSGVAYEKGTTYKQDDTIICKLYGGMLPPLMSAFMVETTFFNGRSLTENHYVTWGYNDLEHIFNYPLITIRDKQPEETPAEETPGE